ncbi:hypothetical protein, partial [Streptomyces sp. NPDC005568]|uniref:hypothetical protein n=1 Tax=Streptomyces sp. NPDC005568 TaxID=3156887 RepID=UPI0033BA7622
APGAGSATPHHRCRHVPVDQDAEARSRRPGPRTSHGAARRPVRRPPPATDGTHDTTEGQTEE